MARRAFGLRWARNEGQADATFEAASRAASHRSGVSNLVRLSADASDYSDSTIPDAESESLRSFGDLVSCVDRRVRERNAA